MSDLDFGQHGGQLATGTAALATMVTAGLAKIFRSRDEKAREEAQVKRETDMLVELAGLKRDMDHALRMLEAQTKLAERVALLERSTAQNDDLRDRMVRVEGKADASHTRTDRLERLFEKLEKES